jgi:hypothetical protein
MASTQTRQTQAQHPQPAAAATAQPGGARKAVRSALDRVTGSLAARRLDAGTQDGREAVRRVLRNLFKDSGESAAALRSALLVSRAAADEVLASLNAEGGRAYGDPRFSDEQHLGLRELLLSPKLESLAPVADSPSGVAAQDQVLAFWTELLSKEPAEVEDFHARVTDYSVDPTEEKLGKVLAFLDDYAPAGTWTRVHADALAEIHTEKIEFKNLAWMHYPGVIW